MYFLAIFSNRLWIPSTSPSWALCPATGDAAEAESGQVCVVMSQSVKHCVIMAAREDILVDTVICFEDTSTSSVVNVKYCEYLKPSALSLIPRVWRPQTWDVGGAAETERVGESAPSAAAASSAGLRPFRSSTPRPPPRPSSPAEPPRHPRRPSATRGAGPTLKCNVGASPWGLHPPTHPQPPPPASTARTPVHTQRLPRTEIHCWARSWIQEAPPQGPPDAAPCWGSRRRKRGQREGGAGWGDEGLRQWNRDVWGEGGQRRGQVQQ